MARRLVAVVLFALTACSGRAVLPMGAPAPAAQAPATEATVDVSIAATLRIGGERRPRYVPHSMKSAKIALKSKTLAIVNLMSGLRSCKGAPLTCSAKFKAPTGRDVFTVTLYDQKNGKGKILAVGSVTAKIVAGKTNTVKVVCDGVVASLALELAQTAPPPSGSAQTIALTLTARDAGGNTIIGPGKYRNGPIDIADSDTSHTQIKQGSGTAGSSVDVSAPGAALSVLYDGNAALKSATLTASMPKASSVAAVSVKMTPAGAAIAVDTANGGPKISQEVLGVNLPVWIDNTEPFIATAYKNAGVKLVRWPGGSLADHYHWADGSTCGGNQGQNASSTFDNFMNHVAVPDNLDVALTVNYGSNAGCNAGGDPAEAYAWARHAHDNGWNVPYWTVGNEVFGSWEYDLHVSKNDAATYASAVATATTGYYDRIKSGYPAAQVGVVVTGPGSGYSSWDTTVISQARYDFVEFHYYAQQGKNYGQAESDSYLLTSGVDNLVADLKSIRTEVDTYNSFFKPIYLGELNSIVSTPGKQTVSIVNGLFSGMAMAEVMKLNGVSLASWWLGSGDCWPSGNNNNFSSSLYGFQDYGSYTLFSDGPGAYNGCPSDMPAKGTPFPDGRAFAMLAQFAGSGSTMRNVTTSTKTSAARFYADTLGSGYGVLLFNLSKTASLTTSVVLKNAARSSFAATQVTYGKAQYDNSQHGTWSGPVTSSLGTVGTSFSVTLPPWSMTLVKLAP